MGAGVLVGAGVSVEVGVGVVTGAFVAVGAGTVVGVVVATTGAIAVVVGSDVDENSLLATVDTTAHKIKRIAIHNTDDQIDFTRCCWLVNLRYSRIMTPILFRRCSL